MYFSLQDKHAFVTGGASGIGLEVAKRFVEAGARVILADRQDGSATAQDLGARYLPLDVSDPEAVAVILDN